MAHGTNQPVVIDDPKPVPNGGLQERSDHSRARAPLATQLDFRAFYSAHFAFVWRCLGLLGVRTSALDDAAQEVFVVAHRRMADFRGDSSQRTWLYGIARNIAANARRTHARKGHYDELKGDEPSSQPDPCERAEAREAVDFVQAFLSGLDEKKRDLFVLAVIEQLTIREVAESQGIPLNTAYARLRTLKIEFQRSIERSRVEP